MTPDQTQLLHYLSTFVTENKKTKIDQVLAFRTRYITIVLEDINKPHNASAVIRTCDCFGLQDVHIIENINTYKVNPHVTQGSSKWVNVFRHNLKSQNNTVHCYEELKKNGYRIYATVPKCEATNINTLAVNHKMALVFGAEDEGLSHYAIEQADELVSIPMYGFTESFNISVSAAICLNVLVNKLHHSGMDWHLSVPEKEIIKLNWYKKIIKHADILEKEFFQKH